MSHVNYVANVSLLNLGNVRIAPSMLGVNKICLVLLGWI